MWYACDVLHTVLYVRVRCPVVRGCAVWRRYIDVGKCDVDLQYEISLTFIAGLVCLCGVCSHGVVLGLSARLSWYLAMWVQWMRCDACPVVCV